MQITGRIIRRGSGKGRALVTNQALGFFGMVDPETGIVTDPGHELHGQSIKDRVLVFPRGKGSTVGSYALYALAWNKAAPAAMVMESCEPIVAVGAVIAEIPTVDQIDISLIPQDANVELSNGILTT